MIEPYSTAADQPKTDRELLLVIHIDIKQVKDQVISMCTQLHDQDERIDRLENWRWYIIGGISILTFFLVLFRQYINLGGI